MIAVLLLGLLQSDEQPTIVQEQRTLSIPREIAHAVAPYAMCMAQDRNQRMLGSRTGAAVRAAIELLKSDCRPERDQAEVRASESLGASNMAEAIRSTMIGDTLASIDRIHDHVAERLDRANRPEQSAE